MPVLMAFYNYGNILMEVNEEQLLAAWKEFFGKGTNWRDFDKNMTYEKYRRFSDRDHIKKIFQMPVHFLLESGKGSFVKRDGTGLALSDELKEIIHDKYLALHMKDVIDFRTMDYYKRRYQKDKQ